MTFRVLDPTPEKAPPAGQLAPRLATLEGKTIGFISNGKEGTKGFFAHLDRVLREEHGVAKVVVRTKSNYSGPAHAHIVAEIRNWNSVRNRPIPSAPDKPMASASSRSPALINNATFCPSLVTEGTSRSAA